MDVISLLPVFGLHQVAEDNMAEDNSDDDHLILFSQIPQFHLIDGMSEKVVFYHACLN